MIPEFDENGYLPPGIHPATLDEIAERFGCGNEIREAEMESLREMVELARRSGVLRIVVNGSFVTDRAQPNDVDCALLIDSAFPVDAAAGATLLEGLPYLGMQIVHEANFRDLTERIFATDRNSMPKGLVEILP